MSKRKINWQKAVGYILDDLHYTQKELAKICGVSQQSISNWRMEVRFPAPASKRQLTKIIEDAGVRINVFYTDYNPKQQATSMDDSLKELVEMFITLPPQRKEFILELTRFEHKQNV